MESLNDTVSDTSIRGRIWAGYSWIWAGYGSNIKAANSQNNKFPLRVVGTGNPINYFMDYSIILSTYDKMHTLVSVKVVPLKVDLARSRSLVMRVESSYRWK